MRKRKVDEVSEYSNSPKSVPKVTHCVKALANECTATVGSFTTSISVSFKKWLTVVVFLCSSNTR